MSIRASLIGRVVAASTRHPVIVLLLGAVLTGLADELQEPPPLLESDLREVLRQ